MHERCISSQNQRDLCYQIVLQKMGPTNGLTPRSAKSAKDTHPLQKWVPNHKEDLPLFALSLPPKCCPQAFTRVYLLDDSPFLRFHCHPGTTGGSDSVVERRTFPFLHLFPHQNTSINGQNLCFVPKKKFITLQQQEKKGVCSNRVSVCCA